MLVAVLVAGADSKIDRSEWKQAIQVARKKRKSVRPSLDMFYAEAYADFEDKLKVLMQTLPKDATERTAVLSQELSRLNQVLPQIDNAFAMEFYRSLLNMAASIAESSGGLLGIMSVGKGESKLMGLTMIEDPARR